VEFFLSLKSVLALCQPCMLYAYLFDGRLKIGEFCETLLVQLGLLDVADVLLKAQQNSWPLNEVGFLASVPLGCWMLAPCPRELPEFPQNGCACMCLHPRMPDSPRVQQFPHNHRESCKTARIWHDARFRMCKTHHNHLCNGSLNAQKCQHSNHINHAPSTM
jgi:hypothetical protein